MSEKVTGYIFLLTGVLIIGFAAFSVYSVFTAKAAPVDLFNFEGVSLPVSALMGEQVPAGAGDIELEIFSPDDINKTANTFAHLFMMGFLSSIGFKIASLGTNLIRPIVVKMDGKKIPSVIDPK